MDKYPEECGKYHINLMYTGPKHLYRGVILADKVIAYDNDRTEFEIIQYRNVKNIEEIAPAGISAEFYTLQDKDPFTRVDLEKWEDHFNK